MVETEAVNTKPKFKQRISARLAPVRSRINNTFSKLKIKRKPAKKLTKSQRDQRRRQLRNVILGICQLLVVVSIVYSSNVILVGVDTLESKIALIPQIAFALFISVKAFSNLYK